MAAATMASTHCVATLQAPLAASSSRLNGAAGSVRAAPVRSARSIVVRAAQQESSSAEPSKSAVIFSAAVGALAAFSVGFGGNAQAAVGPGGPPERTGEKAYELLKAADELTTDDSPPRFGPGRNTREGAEGDETSKLARQAGSGSSPSLQGTQSQLEGAAASTEEFTSNLIGSTERARGANPLSKAAEATGKAADAGGFFSNIQDTLSNLTGSAPSPPSPPSPSEAKGAVESAASDVKSKLPGL